MALAVTNSDDRRERILVRLDYLRNNCISKFAYLYLLPGLGTFTKS